MQLHTADHPYPRLGFAQDCSVLARTWVCDPRQPVPVCASSWDPYILGVGRTDDRTYPRWTLRTLNCLGFQRAGNNKAQNQDRNQLSPFIF